MFLGRVMCYGNLLFNHDGNEDNVDNDVYGGDETVCFII